MSDNPTRSEVIEAHGSWLAGQIAALRAGVESAKDGMRVDGDHRPASRGERGAVSSQGALRAGLLARIAELEEARVDLARIDGEVARVRAGLGALVHVDDEQSERWLAILPGGQGNEVCGAVRVVSPRAPMARALMGLEDGDSAELSRPGGDVELEVLEVR